MTGERTEVPELHGRQRPDVVLLNDDDLTYAKIRLDPQSLAVITESIAGFQSTLARFVFLGYLKKDNRKTIFLSKDNDIILVRKGDKFAGRYEAKSVTDQDLTIVATDSGEEIINPLIENQPLIAAGK